MTLDLTDGEASALAAHLHLILDADPFLLVPRLDPLRSILGKLERNANILSLPQTGADDLPSAPRQEPKRLNAFQPPLGPAVIKPTDLPGKTLARLCGKCDGAGRFSNKLCDACNGTGVELVSDT